MKRDGRSIAFLFNIIFLPIVLTGCISFVSTFSYAADDAVTDPDETTVASDEPAEPTESFYANPAQATHAANLAAKAALSDEATQQARAEYEAAQQDYEDGTIDKKTLEAAETQYQEKLSEVSGVLGEEIGEMRASGMGWGEIAHEIGVHPSALGLGHKKNAKDFSGDEIAEATARNTKTGFTESHGVGVRDSVNGSAMGTAKGLSKAKSSHSAGAASTSGGSKDKSSPGNNKGGNGSGKGGGKGGSNGSGNGGGNGGGKN